jgi:hypothetical protein
MRPRHGSGKAPRHGYQKPLWLPVASALLVAVLGGFGTETGKEAAQEAIGVAKVQGVRLERYLVREVKGVFGSNDHQKRARHLGQAPGPSPSSLPSELPRAALRPDVHKSSPPSVVVPTTAITARPKISVPPKPSPQAAVPRLYVNVQSTATPVVPGISLGLRVTWTPEVSLDGRAVTQGCRIYWIIMNGPIPLHRQLGSCDQVQSLSLPIGIGGYSLIGEVMLQSGETARTVVDIPVNG